MDTVFVPYKSYGDIKFGASRNEVRSLLGEYQEFKKSPFSKNTTDDFGDFHIYYSEDNFVDAIEVFTGETKLNGQILLPATTTEFSTLLESIDKEMMQKNGGIISRVLGCCASISDEDIDGIILCSENYFANLMNT